MDSKIAIGDKLELEKIETHLSANHGNGPQVYVSQVLDEGEFDSVCVAMPIHEGKMIPLNVGQEFMATFYTKSGLLRCRVEVTGRYKKGTLFLLDITPKTALKKMQRREYFRYECRTQIDYRIVGDEEKQLMDSGNAYNTDEWRLEWKKAVMLDLSGGGIRFVSDGKAENDSLLQVRFDITLGEDVEVVYLFAKILRIERNQNNSTLYNYHIKFWRMDHGMREKIIRYIFEQQRKNRSKQLGNE